MMEIVYTNHSKKRMRQRGIEEWEIEHILKHPSYIRKYPEGKRKAVGETKNREVKILFTIEENYIKVITVI